MPINRVTIVGNLTRDPELRATPSGAQVCSMRVAVNERRKNSQTGQWDDVPNFFNVSVWGNAAEASAKFLAKGRQVAVDGSLRWREFQDKDGNRREAVEIVARDVQFIGGKREGGYQPTDDDAPSWAGSGGGPSGGSDDGWKGSGSSGGGPAPAATGGPAKPPPDDDIPF